MSPNLSTLGLIPLSMCERCRNFYPIHTKEWREYPKNLCSKLKERHKREAGISPIGD